MQVDQEAKRCVKCGLLKARDQFYRHAKNKDGLQAYCKSCQQTAPIQYHRDWKRKNRQAIRDKYPDKTRAYQLVESGIKAGLLKRLPCEICGALKVEAHHDDYSKPRDVKWLCREHHLALHRERKLMKGTS